jgi:hypothetical protein
MKFVEVAKTVQTGMKKLKVDSEDEEDDDTTNNDEDADYVDNSEGIHGRNDNVVLLSNRIPRKSKITPPDYVHDVGTYMGRHNNRSASEDAQVNQSLTMLAAAVTDPGSKRNREESSPQLFDDNDEGMSDNGSSEPIKKKKKSTTVESSVSEHQTAVSDRTLAPEVREATVYESTLSHLPQIPEEDLDDQEATSREGHIGSDEIKNHAAI